MAREGIGLRVARWRDIAGMTQQQLADAVTAILSESAPGRSCSHAYISMIESGKRAVTKRDLLFALARALRVSVNDLTGQPYPASTAVDLDSYVLANAVRDAMDGPDDDLAAPRSMVALTAALDQAMAARMACDYVALAQVLPGVLSDSRRLWEAHRRPEAGAVFVRAGAVAGALALKPAGWLDLAILLAKEAHAVAMQLDDPVVMSAANYVVAQCALAAGNRKRSLALASFAADTIDDVESFSDRSRNGLLAWGTMLRLHAALSAATLHQADDANAHLAVARECAGRVQGDPDRMEASLANVATWEVGIALENGEPERAPELARRVDVSELRTAQRRARLRLDAGRAYHLVGDLDAAVRALLAADAAAPGDLRHRPTAVEIVAQMVRAAPTRGGGSSELRTLATKVGVDPLAPPVPA